MADTKDQALDIADSAAISVRAVSPNGEQGIRGGNGSVTDVNEGITTAEAIDSSKKGYFAYFNTREFYVVLLLG